MQEVRNTNPVELQVPRENHGDHISHMILSDPYAGQQFVAFAGIVSMFQVLMG
jgi:hypothetical protein